MGEAIKDFPWRRGMSSNGAVLTDADIVAVRQGDTYGMAPDRTDGATRGAFLDAVREAFGEPLLHVRPAAGGWLMYRVANPGLSERDEVLLTDGSWFDAAEWGNSDGPIRAATEWDAIEAAWNVRPGVKRG